MDKIAIIAAAYRAALKSPRVAGAIAGGAAGLTAGAVEDGQVHPIAMAAGAGLGAAAGPAALKGLRNLKRNPLATKDMTSVAQPAEQTAVKSNSTTAVLVEGKGSSVKTDPVQAKRDFLASKKRMSIVPYEKLAELHQIMYNAVAKIVK
jgi:hypothetical protein